MTATALKMKSNPMAPYLDLMRGMSREQKLAVVAYLVDTMQDEELGGHALTEELTVVTDNVKHFERISGLKIENWKGES